MKKTTIVFIFISFVILLYTIIFPFHNMVLEASEITSNQEQNDDFMSRGEGDGLEGDGLWDILDTTEIQEVLDDLMIEKDFNFNGYVKGLVEGEGSITIQGVIGDALTAMGKEWEANKDTMVRLIIIAVIAALFTNFTNIFQGKQISETGFYITYMLLFTVLTVSFLSVTVVAQRALSDLLSFMKALLPTYFIALAYTTGVNTSLAFYQATMMMIILVNVVLSKIVIPGINIYFILSLSNHLIKEDRFSKMTELLKDVISWSLKTLLGVVIGVQTIQGLIVPITDNVKRSALTKAVGAIPGMGNMFSSAAETVLGAGMLVKNAIGVAGLVVVATICAVPMVKLLIYSFLYQFSAAIVQPISDKRIISCIGATAQSSKLVLFTLSIGAIMFLFSITIVTLLTKP